MNTRNEGLKHLSSLELAEMLTKQNTQEDDYGVE